MKDEAMQYFELKIKLENIKCFNQLISFDLYKIGFEGGDEKRASSEKMGGDTNNKEGKLIPSLLQLSFFQ